MGRQLMRRISIITIFIALFIYPSLLFAAQKVYFYHTDAAGTPVAMTDASGTVVWRADYKPFGEEQSITGTVANNEKFVGKEKDLETGLYYFGARYMDAKTGRFVSVDPAGITEKDLLNPQRLNRYNYSLNNPYRYIDPDGRLTVNIWDYRGKNDAWGHASITLENGKHISWWPGAEGR
jgi:RHS repeat-associated protein